MEAKIDAIGRKVGVSWDAEESHLSKNMGRMPWRSTPKGKSLVRVVMSFIRQVETGKSQLLRSVKEMNLSKAWIAGLVGYIAYFIKLWTGFDIPDEMIDKLSDLVLLGIGVSAMVANMVKGGKTDAQRPGDHGPAV